VALVGGCMCERLKRSPTSRSVPLVFIIQSAALLLPFMAIINKGNAPLSSHILSASLHVPAFWRVAIVKVVAFVVPSTLAGI